MPPPEAPNPQADAEHLEAATQAMAACGGDTSLSWVCRPLSASKTILEQVADHAPRNSGAE